MISPKIIELLLDPEYDEGGLDGIAYVENPAHEALFQYFSEQETQEKPTKYVLSDEDIPVVLQMFASYGEPQGLLEKEGWKIVSVEPMNAQKFAEITSEPNKSSEIYDTPTTRVRFKYVGPKDEKNRPFCADMMAQRRVFRYEDIETMSRESINPVGPDGYSIFEWRGSYNCRHGWVRLNYAKEGTIINNDRVKRNLIDEVPVLGPDTRTTSTIEAGNHPVPRTGVSFGKTKMEVDTSSLTPYVEQIDDDLILKPVLNSMPLFEEEEDALEMAKLLGCEGAHPHTYGDTTLWMPCATHPESEEYEMAEIGPRGGVKESKKAPKSDTPNPNPKGKGTAKGSASTTRGAEVSERVEKILKDKSDEFNERYKDKLDYGVNVGMLKSVYQRGVGAFNVSHSPRVQSAEQWALARVNAFLYLVKEGRPENSKYVGDFDLLPKEHPKYQQKTEQSAIEFASYDDYPQAASDAACKVLRWIDEYGRDEVEGMTQTGLARANQLCNREPISEETIARMAAFERHRQNSEISPEFKGTPWKDKGYVAWLGWGSDEGIEWAQRKLDSIRNQMSFSVMNEEERLVVGPAMIPDKLIIRRNETPASHMRMGEIYYVYFSRPTIKMLQQRFMENKLLDKLNIEHGRRFLNGATVVESWIVEDPEKDKQQVFGMNYPAGTWMIISKVDDDATWEKIKKGDLKGYSVQGYFMENAKFSQSPKELIDEIKQILRQVK